MSDDIERDYDSPSTNAFVKAFVARAKPVTTPTPPDAVREARNAMLGVLLTASSQSVSRLAVAIGLSFDAFESDIVDALLTRPSDARGREAVAEACVWKLDDADIGLWQGECGAEWTFIADGPDENGVKFCPNCGKRRAALSPTQEGAK